MQRTRCAYFYDVASACNKRNPGTGCDARGGDNRLHAVLGWSENCIATHPSDFCVPLVALDAVVEIEGRAGRREIPLETFHRLPGDAPDRESVLEPGEMIVAVRLPAEAARFAAHARYLKVRERTSYAFAVVSAAAALRIEADVIADARFALGGVALEAVAVAGSGANSDRRAGRRRRLFRRAAEVALAEAKPSGDNAFKIELARRVVVRAFALAAAGTPERLPALPGFTLSPPFPELSPMPEITVLQTPAHVRHGSNIGQSFTRREGVLKVTGAAKYAADQHPPGMLYAVLAVSEHRARPGRLSRCRGRKGPSRRRRGDHAGEPAAARAGSG